ncbi:alpha/beta hydrolase [Ktedonosporobacter rubrisoli]|uniref:Alpha/beta hydrolase n=1 Tax=Ktedonosporobacter rubrisoli TaxID=2509675 RepID=A0A4P6JPT1_KTERU|nr:alpha/beta hydrolase [Ktedonosporobacter rubrisoli]QBD77274.1 alpha/beta hydrolase [Ktedonosporobacter rubrisoli]
MHTKTTSNNQATTPVREHYTTGIVTSQDGTSIGYRQYGHGPSIVLVQGGMGSAHNFHQLAGTLADTFTVYVPDRRGRGLSSPHSNDYSIQKDVEDLDALLMKTDARQVFGLSTGGLIVLRSALVLPTIHKLAIYEPALSVNGSTPLDWVKRYDKEMAQGNVAAALITGMLGPKMGPPIMQYIPRLLLEFLTKMMLAREDKNGSGEYLSMRTLAPTLHHDGQVLFEMSETLENFHTVQAKVLLLGGSKSAAFQKASLDALEKVLPHVTRVEFPGLDHGSVWNYDKQRNPGGKPELVAQELRRFFAEP